MKKLVRAVIISLMTLSLTGCTFIDTIQSVWNSFQEDEHVEEYTYRADEVIPNFKNCYFLSQLDGTDLAFVVKAYEGLMNFDENIEIGFEFDNNDRPQELLQLIQYDCPEIFQFTTNGSSNVIFNWIQSKKQLVSMDITYLMTEDEYKDAYSSITNELVNLTNQANQFDNDFDKELFVYNYIVDSCNYNENTLNYSSSYGVFIDHEAACLGLSRTMQWAMAYCDIDCITVGGFTKNKESGHAWNIIKLDGKYYSLDITSDTTRKDTEGIKLYIFFNVTDEEFSNQYTLQKGLFNVPETKDTYYNYYRYTNRYCGATELAEDKLTEILSNAYYNGESNCTIQFEMESDYNYIVQNITEIYNNWLNDIGHPQIKTSYSNVDDYQVLYFQFD